MRFIAVHTLLVVFLLSPVFMGCTSESNSKKPNIILIMTDDQGWFMAGFNGNRDIKTPHLDALAGEGIILDRFYSASAVCSPTRASVLTGRNPLRIGIPTANSGHMKGEEITLPELLKEAGYRTGHFGKWHLGVFTTKERDSNRGGKKGSEKHYSIPTMHGYDEFFCTEAKVPTYDPMILPEVFNEDESRHYGWAAARPGDVTQNYGTAYWKAEGVKATENLSGEDTRVMTDRALTFIRRSAEEGEPFFMTLWIHAPHLPVVANSADRALYSAMPQQEQLYFGCISALDKQVGRLWAELVNQGIEGNTMIWFCSDNGPERNTPGSAGPFRGRKRSLYEGGLRTPAFLVWKDRLDGNQRMFFPAVTSDYLPTILDVLDMDYPDDRPLDGQSIWPLIENPRQDRGSPIGFIFGDQVSWVNHRYKLYSPDKGQTFELYDLIDDKTEARDIISQHPDVAAGMQAELEEWLKSVENSNKGKDY